MKDHQLCGRAIVSQHCTHSRHLDIESALFRVFLVPHFDTSNFGNDIVFEREIVFRLRLFVHILDHDVDGLSDIAFVEVCVSYQIYVLKDGGWFEVTAQNLLRRLRGCEIRVCRAECAGEQAA